MSNASSKAHDQPLLHLPVSYQSLQGYLNAVSLIILPASMQYGHGHKLAEQEQELLFAISNTVGIIIMRI